jgi:hypothetical protein
MSENRISESRLREQQELAKQRACAPKSSAGLAWKVVGGLALAVVAVGLITSLHDIRRYIKISTM